MAQHAFTPTELGQLSAAIVDAFDVESLTPALRFAWGVRLTDVVNTAQGFIGVVNGLLNWTEMQGRTFDLLEVLAQRNPGNPKLKAIAAQLGAGLPATRPATLQKAVNERSHFVDFNEFLSRFVLVGLRVCRVETPTQSGTGFLVGPDRVLSNFHLVEDILGQRTPAEHIVCRFDYSQGAAGQPAAGTPIHVAAGGIGAHRNYSKADLTGVGQPAADELDYVLLRLERKIGEESGPTGTPRGWFALDQARLLGVGDLVVVPQHPNGGPLQVAWGQVTGFNESGTRIRYDTRTDRGSSGSICLDVDLVPFGLHHAAGPTQALNYNQAVPLRLIVADLLQRDMN